LIAVNAIIVCIKENPHRRKRKEAEKLNRDLDNLTPLDARNSLLMEPMSQQQTEYKGGAVRTGAFGTKNGDYVAARSESPAGYSEGYSESQYSRPSRYRDDDGYSQGLVGGAAGMGHRNDRSLSRSPPEQQPTLPALDFGFGNNSHGR